MKLYFMKLKILLLSAIIWAQFCYAEPDLKIAFIGPTTGNAAILGQDVVPALQIALNEQNAHEVKLIVEDDQYLTQKAVTAYNKIKAVDDPDVIILLTYGALFALEKNISKSDSIIIDTLDCDNNIARLLARNIICISKGTEDLGEVIAKKIIKEKLKKVSAIYFDGDPFMGVLTDATIKYLQDNSDVELVASDGYSDTTDFKSILLRAKNKQSEGYIFYGYDSLANALVQARSLGINSKFFGVNTASGPVFKSIAKDALNDMYISSYQAPRTKDYDNFANKFWKLTKRNINFEVSTFPSYDAIKILLNGLKEYKQENSTLSKREYLLNYLYKTNNYKGLAGTITIDQDGATRSLKNELFQFKNQELVKVE
jgi:branched-chain amino acid transport system substrate-binding protein